MEIDNVVIMGMGYIGLPSAALIASLGVRVIGVDVDESVVNRINRGEVHIVEPNLEELVKNTVKRGTLTAVLKKPVEADVYVIAVPTPFKPHHEPDISCIKDAVDMILPCMREDCLVIIESTSPVGTTGAMYEHIIDNRPELRDRFCLAYCPERVLPGNTLKELQSNARVIGGMDEAASEAARNFYSLFVRGELHITNAKTAEMCKLAENSFRDVNIAFANELSMLAREKGVDVWELINLANKHPRVEILQPGPGVGGHCIAVDPWFLIYGCENQTLLMKCARDINNQKQKYTVSQIKEKIAELRKAGREPKIACMGLAYKPGSDDLRESPSLEITRELIQAGYTVLAAEPNLNNHKEIELVDYNRAATEADIIVYLVKHKEFISTLNNVNGKEILDFCGIARAV